MAPVQGASGGLSGAAGHPASVAALEVLTPEQAAQLLSVSVEDVLASRVPAWLRYCNPHPRRVRPVFGLARNVVGTWNGVPPARLWRARIAASWWRHSPDGAGWMARGMTGQTMPVVTGWEEVPLMSVMA